MTWSKLINLIKKNKIILIYGMLLITYGVFISLRSPLSPGARFLMGNDSSVFMYMAQGIDRGLIPYAEIFDHKGMIIYIINWIGIKLFNGTMGIWIMEMIFLFINFIVVWKISKLFSKNNMIAFFTTIITFLPYMIYYFGGNKVETWTMTFILIALYTFIKYLKNRPEISKWNILISGMATAAILWCKPNLIIVDIVFIPIIRYRFINKKTI